MYKVLVKKIFIFLSLFLLVGCSPDESTFYHANLGLTQPKIIVASQFAGAYGIAMYNIDGTFVKTLKEYNPQNIIPRGLSAINSYEFYVAFDGGNIDTVEKFSLIDGPHPFVNDTNLSGTIQQMRYHATYGTFVIETNNIESFDNLGQRIGNPFLATVIGGCALNTPRGMAFNSSDNLVVVNSGNDRINLYNVSNPVNPTCVISSAALPAASQPFAVLAHSNGKLYIATQGNDRIYEMNGNGTGAVTQIFSNVGFIDNPSALLEMPDGSLLVASDNTNTVVNITTSGALIGSNYLFSDLFTNSISDMILLKEGP